jgi:hypothetical protein
MKDFYSRKPLGIWEIIAFGALAAAGVATIGYLVNDPRLYVAAPICGVFIGGFGFILGWTRAKIKPIPSAPGQPARYPRWVYWMFWGGLSVSTALKLWDLFEKK